MTFWDYPFTQRNASTSLSSAVHAQSSEKSAMASLADRTHADEQTPHSSLRTALVFSAILVPCAAIPYLLIRGHYHLVLKELTNLRVANESFAREMRRFTTTDAPRAQKGVENVLAAVREHRAMLEANAAALADVKESLDAARARVDDLQGKVDRLEANVAARAESTDRAFLKAHRAGVEQHKARVEWEEQVKRSLGALSAANIGWRSTIADDMKETGMSLADIAGFVEEVERREGWTPLPKDGRGIDRMRKLAKRLGEHGQPELTKLKPTKLKTTKSELKTVMGLESTKSGPTQASKQEASGSQAKDGAEPSPSE